MIQLFCRSIIYGRLGIEIATAIVSSILPYDSSWSRNEGLLSSYHLVGNQSLKVANAPQICLSQFVTRNKFATEEIAQLTSLSTLKHITALRLADTVCILCILLYLFLFQCLHISISIF